MLAALHIYIVWKYYQRIISAAQHCYNYNFCSFFLPALEGLHMLQCWTVLSLSLSLLFKSLLPPCAPAKLFAVVQAYSF